MLCGKCRVRTQDLGYQSKRYDHCTTRPFDDPIHFFSWAKEKFGADTTVLQCGHHLFCKFICHLTVSCPSFPEPYLVPPGQISASGPNIQISISWLHEISYRYLNFIKWNGYCHGRLCGAHALAKVCWYDRLCAKTFPRTNQIRDITSSNQQVHGDRCNSQITELMLKSLSVFCNHFKHCPKTIRMLESLQL